MLSLLLGCGPNNGRFSHPDDPDEADGSHSAPDSGDSDLPNDPGDRSDPVPPADVAPSDGGDGPPPDPCANATNAPPKAPRILEPAAGAANVSVAVLLIRGSAIEDLDGDRLGAATFEIWRFKDGALDRRVWQATVYGGRREVRLSEGDYAGTATALLPWKDYAVRVQYKDDAQCARVSEWSAPVTFRTDDGSDYFFDETVIRDFSLDIPPTSWWLINSEAGPAECVPYHRSYYPAGLSFEGTSFDDIGLHIKGGCGSSRDLSGKAAFKANLSWDDPAVPGCPIERRLYGEKHFTFNNMVQDPTMAHETLGYIFFRALGLPAPRTSHVQLFVNGELWGLYLHLETVDRRFLSRHFASARGAMYEGTHMCDLVRANLPATDTDPSCFDSELGPDACDTVEVGDDPAGFTMLRRLVEQLEALPPGGFYPAVENIFDFDEFLTAWAASNVIAHWDGYEDGHITNFRFYHDPSTDRWSLIQTGIDQTFSGTHDPWDVNALLVNRCLAEYACEAAFASRLRSAADAFEGLGLAAEAQRIYQRIRPYVAADPRKPYDVATFDQSSLELQQWIEGRPWRIRAYLEERGF